jgi:hypothetical protein
MSGVLRKIKQSALISVAEFGILPDGVTNWENVGGAAWTNMLQAALSTGVRWPKGYYATGLNLDSSYSGARFHFDDGAVLGGVFHMISGPNPVAFGITSITRTANVVTVNTSAAHGWNSGQRVRISNVYVTGANTVDFNGDDFTIAVTGPTSYTYPQAGPDSVGTATYGALTAERPIKDVVVTGRLATTDRFGAINAKDCHVERVWVKSDPTQHSAYPGTTCRGAHIYVGTENLHIEELIIDDASGANTDAALAMDGSTWNPKNITIDYCHIKDSAYHGAYITGGGHRFGTLRIDGFARDVYAGTLQESDGAVQSQQVKALWLNRVWNMKIGALHTSQNPAGSRGYEVIQALVDETGSSYFGTLNQSIQIDAWYANNLRRGGIRFGEGISNSHRCNLTIGLMEIRLDPAGLTAGEYALRCYGGDAGSRVSIETLRLVDFGANRGVWTETSATLSVRKLEASGHQAQVLYARGKVTIFTLHTIWAGGSSPDPAVQFANPGVAGSYIHCLHFESPAIITVRVFQADAACNGWDIGKLTTSGTRHGAGTVYLDSLIGWGIHTLRMAGPDNTGIAIQFAGSSTDGYLGPGRIEGFATGLDRNAAGLSRLTAVGLNAAGNTTPTNIPNGSAQALGCNAVTL